MAKLDRASSPLRRAKGGKEMSVPIIVHTKDGAVEIPREVLCRFGLGPGDAVVVYQLGEEIRIEPYVDDSKASS